MNIDIDVRELTLLAADLARVPDDVVSEVPAVVKKAAQNIKDEWAALNSRHFKVGASVSYDETVWFGQVAEAEIGPTPGGAGSLAGIFHFGGANGGGGSGGDPQRFADAEEPRMMDALGDLIGGAL